MIARVAFKGAFIAQEIVMPSVWLDVLRINILMLLQNNAFNVAIMLLIGLKRTKLVRVACKTV